MRDETFHCAGCKVVMAAQDLNYDIKDVQKSLSRVGVYATAGGCVQCNIDIS